MGSYSYLCIQDSLPLQPLWGPCLLQQPSPGGNYYSASGGGVGVGTTPLLPPLTSTVWSLPPSTFGASLPPAMQTLVTSPPLPTATAAFSLSPATEPFPQKLILSGQLVDMREMLTDNVSLLQQLEIMGGQTAPGLPGVLRPHLREVNTLATWIYCFLAYVAIRSPDPYVRVGWHTLAWLFGRVRHAGC